MACALKSTVYFQCTMGNIAVLFFLQNSLEMTHYLKLLMQYLSILWGTPDLILSCANLKLIKTLKLLPFRYDESQSQTCALNLLVYI